MFVPEAIVLTGLLLFAVFASFVVVATSRDGRRTLPLASTEGLTRPPFSEVRRHAPHGRQQGKPVANSAAPPAGPDHFRGSLGAQRGPGERGEHYRKRLGVPNPRLFRIADIDGDRDFELLALPEAGREVIYFDGRQAP